MIKIDYLGLKCGVCRQDFKENDDVVVCPDCGTPMHRSCYKENKGCPNADKHGEGFVFEGFDKIKSSAQGVQTAKKELKPETTASAEKGADNAGDNHASDDSGISIKKEITCPYCGELNKPDANFCSRCGSKFVKIQPIPVMNTNGNSNQTFPQNPFSVPVPPQAIPYAPDPLSHIPPNTEFEENVTAADLTNFVSINTPYYMRVFDLLKRKAKKFNLSAFLFSGIWFLYRKLYKIGSLIFSIEALLYAIRFYFSQSYSLNIMKSLFADIGLSTDQITNLTMDQYIALSNAMQSLPVSEQLIMLIPSFLFILQLVIMVVCGVIGNKLYYKHCVKRIQTIKKMAKDESLDSLQTQQAIYFGGGVNPFVAGAISLIYLFLFL